MTMFRVPKYEGDVKRIMGGKKPPPLPPTPRQNKEPKETENKSHLYKKFITLGKSRKPKRYGTENYSF